MDALQAEQRRADVAAETRRTGASMATEWSPESGSAPGAAMGWGWPTGDRLGQNRNPNTAGPQISRAGVEKMAQQMRGLDPNEIRADELKNLIERIRLIDRATGPYGYRGETERIIAGRIEALRPEQPTLQSVEDQILNYRQETVDQIVVDREHPWRHDGAALRLTVDLQPNANVNGEYRIPPYQLDQIRAIADGLPSWPSTVSAPDQPDSPIVGLSKLVESLRAETTDLKEQEIHRTKLAAADTAMALLIGDHKGLLDREAATILVHSIVGGLASILVGD